MKKFACGAVVPQCQAKFEAESEEELLRQVAEHARADHKMSEVPPEVVAQVRANIETAE